jgi:prevent-host-death family protein
MASIVNIHETKTHLSRLLVRVERGEEIVIARSGKPVAVLTAVTAERAPRERGLGRDSVVIHANLDDPLPEFEELGR